MKKLIPISIPDIGSFDSVEVIEVMIKVGDSIKKEDSLIVVESEKASMDIPSPFEGIVEEIKVKVGDQVKEGIEIIVITASENTAEKSQEKEVQKKEQHTLHNFL